MTCASAATAGPNGSALDQIELFHAVGGVAAPVQDVFFEGRQNAGVPLSVHRDADACVDAVLSSSKKPAQWSPRISAAATAVFHESASY